MHRYWHQFVQLFWWAGTTKGTVYVLGLGVVGGLGIGVILIAIKVVSSIPRIWREALAADRAKRSAKQQIPSDDSQSAPPTTDI